MHCVWIGIIILADCFFLKYSFWNQNATSYCWWKKACTTKHVWNPVSNGISTISTGAEFLPSTVVSCFSSIMIWFSESHFFLLHWVHESSRKQNIRSNPIDLCCEKCCSRYLPRSCSRKPVWWLKIGRTEESSLPGLLWMRKFNVSIWFYFQVNTIVRRMCYFMLD